MGKSGMVAGFCRGGRLLSFGRLLTRLDRCLAERSICRQTFVWMEGVGGPIKELRSSAYCSSNVSKINFMILGQYKIERKSAVGSKGAAVSLP